ncbi:MAG: gamma-glutamylcyclotransferase family protein [Sporolactobacillus sp.]
MSRTKRRLYIAYGSNLNFEQMARRCPTAQAVGISVMKNWQLLFRGETESAVATVERFRGGFVPILVWQLQPQDETALDRYEGWPHLYHKETVRIRLNNKTVSAMIYIMNDEIRPYGLPGPYYLNIIREGYVSSGFDVDTLYQAVLDSKAAAKRSKNA